LEGPFPLPTGISLRSELSGPAPRFAFSFSHLHFRSRATFFFFCARHLQNTCGRSPPLRRRCRAVVPPKNSVTIKSCFPPRGPCRIPPLLSFPGNPSLRRRAKHLEYQPLKGFSSTPFPVTLIPFSKSYVSSKFCRCAEPHKDPPIFPRKSCSGSFLSPQAKDGLSEASPPSTRSPSQRPPPSWMIRKSSQRFPNPLQVPPPRQLTKLSTVPKLTPLAIPPRKVDPPPQSGLPQSALSFVHSNPQSFLSKRPILLKDLVPKRRGLFLSWPAFWFRPFQSPALHHGLPSVGCRRSKRYCGLDTPFARYPRPPDSSLPSLFQNQRRRKTGGLAGYDFLSTKIFISDSPAPKHLRFNLSLFFGHHLREDGLPAPPQN